MDTIKLAMPFDLVKAETDRSEMRIGGYASTADKDREGESVMQKSLDISEFVNTGFFNLDHDGSKILGYPDADKCRIDNRGLYVEGILLKGVKEAESIYETAVALRKSHAPRKLGFSVEGRVLGRNGAGLITKAKVYNVAITSQPVNPNCTWDALCKSFAHTYADSDDLSKALDTEAGEPLTPESLDKALCNLAHIIEQGDDALAAIETLKSALRKRNNLKKSEAALYLALSRKLTLPESVSVIDTIFNETGGKMHVPANA